MGYQETATHHVQGTAPSGTNPGGMCFADTNTSVDCQNSIFSAASYRGSETCDDHQPDPNRPDEITDPIIDCQQNTRKLWKQAKKLCNQYCTDDAAAKSCIYDACVMQDLAAADSMSEQCEFDEDL